MKKKRFIIIILIFLIGFVSSLHIVTNPTGGDTYTSYKDAQYIYHVRIINEDTGINSSVIETHIVLPNEIAFVPETSTTDAEYETFYNDSNVLTWKNPAGLIKGNEMKYFEFKATPHVTGDYIIEVITLNSTGQFSSNLFVEVIQGCIASWNCTNWSICTNNTQKRICNDINNCEDESGKPNEIRACSATSTNCTPSWQCTVWSECINNIQIRSCVDVNLCGDKLDKPPESQDCISACKPVWDCSSWKPIICSKDETQARNCVDVNNCGYGVPPDETRECKRDALLLFIISIIIIITVIVMISIRTIEEWKKNKEKKDFKNETTKNVINKPRNKPPNQFFPQKRFK